MRVLILAQAPSEGAGSPLHETVERSIQGAGWVADLVTLKDGARGATASQEETAIQRTARQRLLRSARRSARRLLRRTLQFLHAEQLASAGRDLAGRVAGAFAHGAAVRRAHDGCEHYLADLEAQRERLGDASYAESVWEWHKRLLCVTYALPRNFVTAAADRVGAQILQSHRDSPIDVVVLVRPTPRIAAVGYLVTRALEIPVVADECWAEDPGRLPSAAHLLKDRVLARADGRFESAPTGANAPVGHATHFEADATGGIDGDAVVEAVRDAVQAEEFRRTARSAVRPVVTALIEATSDVDALMRTVASLRQCELPNWEALVVVAEGELALKQDVFCAIDELNDDRVRVFDSVVRPFDLYGADVQHRARADHYVRIAAGAKVAGDFVTRAASFVFSEEDAEGYYWRGTLIKPGRGWRPANRGAHAYRPSLTDRAMAWYALDGEYVMTWRLFRFFGGFSHVPAGRHSTQIEQIVLSEAAALSGLLFEKEVPLAYRRMATLSRAMEGEPAEGIATRVLTPDPDAFVDDSAPSVGKDKRYDGRTVAFVRHALVGYDARLLKEAATLATQGARVVVAGIAEDVPESLGALGYDVVSSKDKRDVRRVAERLAALRPDVVHAYDVLSYDLVKRVLENANVKLVYELRDLLVAPGYWTEERRLAEGAKEREIIERADAVIAVSTPSAEWVEREYGISGVASIMHGATTVAREAEPVHEPVRLLFQGALRPNRGLFSLITAVERFAGQATLTFQSFGIMENAIRRYAVELGLQEHVDFLDACAPLEVVQYAASFDVGVICYPGSTENLLRTAPNKLLDYLSAGLAIVASDLPGVRTLADESNCAFFEPGSAGALAEAISSVIGDRERLARRKAASLERAREHRWSVEQERLLEVYDAVFGSVT